MGLISSVSGGNPVSSTWGNAIRDAAVMNVLASEVASITAVEGQLIYVSDEDRFYTYNGSAWVRVGWGATTTGRTGCTVLRNANQSIPSNVARQGITFDAEDFDSDGFFTASSTDITIPTGLGGLYGVSFTIWWATNPGTSSYTRLAIVPTSGNYGNIDGDSSTGAMSTLGGTPFLSGNGAFWVFNAGDKVQLFCSQQSGGAINVTCRVQLYRIGV
jgi:hypothetical protein